MAEHVVIHGIDPSTQSDRPVVLNSDGTIGGSSGGGGGGASTIADGADVAQGAVADTAYTIGNGTVISLLKGIFTKLASLVTGTVITGTGINVAATPTVVANVTADANASVAAAAGLRLMGYAVKERSGTTPATFAINHGATVGGGVDIIPITLLANESDRVWFGPDGIAVASGISINWISGNFDITFFTKAVA